MAPEQKVALKCLSVTFVPVLVVLAATGHYTLRQWISGLLIYAVAALMVASVLPAVVRARWRRESQRQLRHTHPDQQKPFSRGHSM